MIMSREIPSQVLSGNHHINNLIPVSECGANAGLLLTYAVPSLVLLPNGCGGTARGFGFGEIHESLAAILYVCQKTHSRLSQLTHFRLLLSQEVRVMSPPDHSFEFSWLVYPFPLPLAFIPLGILGKHLLQDSHADPRCLDYGLNMGSILAQYIFSSHSPHCHNHIIS